MVMLAALGIDGPRAQVPAGQEPLAAASTPTTFRSPDGSRFVLVPDASLQVVHWAIATPAEASDEPPGLEGLALATAFASLGGTWRTGSLDKTREPQALMALDRAWHDLLAAPQAADSMVQLRLAEAEAAALGDTAVFGRVLAGLPAHDPQVLPASPACIFELTTLPSAIGDVGALLVERREQQALRDLPGIWMRELVGRQQAYDNDPRATLHAEVLALALPNHPANRAMERPRGMPRREQALAVWHATQRPERTVHVLLGGFDADAARATLLRTFATTNLPTLPRTEPTPPRPIQSLRRSTVPGLREPVLAVAWLLPEVRDPFVLQAAVRWLGDGPDSCLGQALQRAGRSRATVQCRAPWPASLGGGSVLLLEVVDAAGLEGLTDVVLAACRDAAGKEIPATDLQPVLASLQRSWSTITREPRWLARELARIALVWPAYPVTTALPTRLEARAVQDLLARTFAGQPVVVEGRP